MLSHLVIRNFAVIDHTEIAFGEQLTVLTGETGAGKSIIINALNLLLAGRANNEVIRTGADHAVVEGIFDLEHPETIDIKLEELGMPVTEGQLVVRRIIARSGRNKVFINGSATTLAVLADLTRGLVDVSGQHEHVSLLDPERHLEILDAFAKLQTLRKKMAKQYDAVAKIRTEIAQLSTDIAQRLGRIDYLKFQLAEIEKAELKPGESVSIDDELAQLKTPRELNNTQEKRSISVTKTKTLRIPGWLQRFP